MPKSSYDERPLGVPREVYRGLAIHADPWFTWSAWTPGPRTRVATGKTLAACCNDADSYLNGLSADSETRMTLEEPA